MYISYLRNVIGSVTPDSGQVGTALFPLQEKTKMIALIAITCITALFCGLYLYFRGRVSRLVTNVTFLTVDKKFDEAKLECKNALKRNPKEFEVLTSYASTCRKHGLALREEGKFEEANKQFAKADKQYKKALEIKPNDIDALESYARLLKDQGRSKEAATQFAKVEEKYKEAIAANPKDIEILSNYGSCLYAQKKFGEMAEQYEKVLILDAKKSAAWHYLGKAYYRLGQMDVAEAKFFIAALLPNARWYDFYWHGRALYVQGKYEDAAMWFKEALKNVPQSFTKLDKHCGMDKSLVKLFIYTAALQAKLGQVDSAKIQLNKALESDNPKLKDKAAAYLKTLNDTGTFEI